MILYAKIAMTDLQQYPFNLYLIKHVEDNFILLTQKVFNSDRFSFASYKKVIRATPTWLEKAFN